MKGNAGLLTLEPSDPAFAYCAAVLALRPILPSAQRRFIASESRLRAAADSPPPRFTGADVVTRREVILEPVDLRRAAQRFFIASDKRLRPCGVRPPRFLWLGTRLSFQPSLRNPVPSVRQ